jgi:hypothetical protein
MENDAHTYTYAQIFGASEASEEDPGNLGSPDPSSIWGSFHSQPNGSQAL